MLELVGKQGRICVSDEGGGPIVAWGVLTVGRGEVRESNIMVFLWLATMIVCSIEDSVSASE